MAYNYAVFEHNPNEQRSWQPWRRGSIGSRFERCPWQWHRRLQPALLRFAPTFAPQSLQHRRTRHTHTNSAPYNAAPVREIYGHKPKPPTARGHTEDDHHHHHQQLTGWLAGESIRNRDQKPGERPPCYSLRPAVRFSIRSKGKFATNPRHGSAVNERELGFPVPSATNFGVTAASVLLCFTPWHPWCVLARGSRNID